MLFTGYFEIPERSARHVHPLTSKNLFGSSQHAGENGMKAIRPEVCALAFLALGVLFFDSSMLALDNVCGLMCG
jgi:hypothetical protein